MGQPYCLSTRHAHAASPLATKDQPQPPALGHLRPNSSSVCFAADNLSTFPSTSTRSSFILSAKKTRSEKAAGLEKDSNMEPTSETCQSNGKSELFHESQEPVRNCAADGASSASGIDVWWLPSQLYNEGGVEGEFTTLFALPKRAASAIFEHMPHGGAISPSLANIYNTPTPSVSTPSVWTSSPVVSLVATPQIIDRVALQRASPLPVLLFASAEELKDAQPRSYSD